MLWFAKVAMMCLVMIMLMRWLVLMTKPRSVPSLIQPSEKFRRPECRSRSAILVNTLTIMITMHTSILIEELIITISIPLVTTLLLR